MTISSKDINHTELLQKIDAWSKELGFQQLGISDINLSVHEDHLNNWLEAGFHGEMDYMQKMVFSLRR